MAGMHFRFRKSFDIIPGLLRWTVSKRGASLNLHLGFYSKSWGTGGRRTTTIDMPGTTGMFWRKQERVKEDPNDADEGFGHLVQLLLIWGGALVAVVRFWLDSHGHTVSGHPYRWIGGLLVGELIVFWMLWRTWRPLAGWLGVLLAALVAYLQWKYLGNVVFHHDIHR